MIKEDLRKKLIKRRANLSENDRLNQSYEIMKQLFSSEHYKNADIIFTYRGINREINTKLLIKQALSDGKRVALPAVFEKGRMAAYLVDDLPKIESDKYGINSPIPENSTIVEPKNIDLAIIPLLGYNLHGYRIGYGGGYYDKYLPKLSVKCPKIGLAYKEQLVEDLPVEVNDYPLDMVLTPDGFANLMTRVETHCHCSRFSLDCSRSFEDLINEAEQKNFKILTLTDHYDKDIIKGKSYPGTKVGSKPRPDEWIYPLDEYVDFCLTEQEKLSARNSNTELLVGIELGYQDYLSKDYQEVIPKYPFDLIIGSIHAMYKDDFAVNGESLYGQGKQQAYDAYLSALIEMVESGLDFDILGHFDYVIRYGGYDDPRMYYDDYADLFDHLFKLIIERDISLEVNTRTRYRQIISENEDWGMTDLKIFQRYYDLGGRMLSFATDAHSVGELHCLISETVQAFKNIGFTQGTFFKQRQPVFYELL